MARDEADCPVCEGTIPLFGDEQPGDEVYCEHCGMMSKLKAARDEEAELEADW